VIIYRITVQRNVTKHLATW